MQGRHPNKKLHLRAGEWVEVRSQAEILASLDEHGRFDNLPFMPEMLQYCGQRLRVSKRADKTCDPAHEPWSIRRMTDSVHLEGARCDGAGHGGCQAGCLIFWNEEWLKRADDRVVMVEDSGRPSGVLTAGNGACTVGSLLSASHVEHPGKETVYICQATTLRDYTTDMNVWDPRQYIRDLRSGNLASGLASDSPANRVLELVLGSIRLLRALVIYIFNRLPKKLSDAPYPFVAGTPGKTPAETLNLQDGELVQVVSKEEIMGTLDEHLRNRGMLFDAELLPYCGGIYRVLRRVRRIIDERTGKMLEMKHPCIVLEGVICQSEYHRFCPRAIYPYWRENWLRRMADVPCPSSTDHPSDILESS
jgi:hypothetical protein